VNENYCRALELLKKAEEFGYLDSGFYYSTHGQAMLGMKNYENAIRDFERCIAIDHRVSDLAMLAEALSKNNDKRALSTWHQVLEKEKNNCLAHVFIGSEFLKSGDRGKALLMAKRAEKLNPREVEFVDIGTLYYDLDEFQSAINMFLEANRLGYKHKSFLYAIIAACYLSLGQAAQAKTYALWALQHEPVNDFAKIIWSEYEERNNS
jgi:tetratricopeptide (TPR) repeat protein